MEPYHIDDEEDTTLPERLKAILRALADYHTYLLQQNTLQTQVPDQVNNIQAILKNQANIILIALKTGNTNSIEDKDLAECLTSLQQNNTPYDFVVDTLLKYWLNMMFIEYPFIIAHNHIERLLKNSLYKEDDEPNA
jgi:hypothetical protein